MRMEPAPRSEMDRRIIAAVMLATIVFLTLGARLDMWLLNEMRNNARLQFNKQQLVIARNVKHEVERQLDKIKQEMSILCREIEAQPANLDMLNKNVRNSFKRIRENGVFRVEIVNEADGLVYSYIPDYSFFRARRLHDPAGMLAGVKDMPESGGFWVSLPRGASAGRFRILAGSIVSGDTPVYVFFHISLKSLFSSFLPDIRSGKTGYAWVVDQEGKFLYHPESSFVGENAFTVREERKPGLSFKKINFIQKERMLQGEEGTGAYVSGWHREMSGEIEKLIAYCPIRISANPSRFWSVAVVAPKVEIEAYISRTNLWRVFLQGTIIGLVVFASGSVLYIEMKWSRVLEDKVQERTDELKKSEEKYRSLVENAEDFIFTLDAGSRFQSVNSSAAGFFGGRAEDYTGSSIEAVLPAQSAENLRKTAEQVFMRGKSLRREFRIRNASQGEIWISANFMPIRDKQGQAAMVLCIARDITEAKEIEMQLINTEKLAALGTLAAGVAHEINNPLGVILGFCDLLSQEVETGSQVFEDIKTIERQGFHCKEIVENLLSFARLGEDSADFSDLDQCLMEIFDIVRHTLETSRIVLKYEPAENIPLVKGGPREVKQVFLNLINNSCAAMREGGDLRIRTSIDASAEMAVIVFRDTGPGIAREHLDHIFEPFYTTKPEGEGTGLGLSVSYGIIAKYGGTIECGSSSAGSPGALEGQKGAEFIIRLPFYRWEKERERE